MSESVKAFFSEEQQHVIVEAIRRAELMTSGEIRVHLDGSCQGDPVRKAIAVFRWLKMHKTAQRNGVLIYLAVKDSKFAVIGDKGINTHVRNDFWDTVRDSMHGHFVQGTFVEGLVSGIDTLATELSVNFPYQEDDVDELPNEISFGDGK